MSRKRMIVRAVKSRPTLEGAGVSLRRAFGFGDVEAYDPFLLLDDFRSESPDEYLAGFPWHPHRGIETITYMLRGRVEHGDSLGNAGVIGGGDVQWMTAGSGIIHQEMPKGDAAGAMGGFQLWANLPARQKMTDPRYRDVRRGDIPVIRTAGGAEVRVVAGRLGDARGPVGDIAIDPEYLDVTVPPGATFEHPVARGRTAMAYVFEGRGCFCDGRKPFSCEAQGRGGSDLQRDASVSDGMLVLFGDGDEIGVTTEGEPARFLLLSGTPLREPVAWQGPIVMNTQEELRVAFEEYRDGTFLRHAK